MFGSGDDMALKNAKKKALQANIDAKNLELNRDKKNLSTIR